MRSLNNLQIVVPKDKLIIGEFYMLYTLCFNNLIKYVFRFTGFNEETGYIETDFCCFTKMDNQRYIVNGGNNGSVTVSSISGGSGGPFQVKIDSGTYTTVSTSITFSSLSAGSHTIYIKDSAGKVEEYTRTLTQPTALGIFAQKTGFDQIYAQVSGGASGSKTFELYRDFDAPYENSGGTLYDTLFDASNVTFGTVGAGYYYVKVTDSNGCTETTAYIITM